MCLFVWWKISFWLAFCAVCFDIYSISSSKYESNFCCLKFTRKSFSQPLLTITQIIFIKHKFSFLLIISSQLSRFLSFYAFFMFSTQMCFLLCIWWRVTWEHFPPLFPCNAFCVWDRVYGIWNNKDFVKR